MLVTLSSAVMVATQVGNHTPVLLLPVQDGYSPTLIVLLLAGSFQSVIWFAAPSVSPHPVGPSAPASFLHVFAISDDVQLPSPDGLPEQQPQQQSQCCSC